MPETAQSETRLRIKMLEFRQGWFWPEPLEAGRVYVLPEGVAKYLVGLGAAEAVQRPQKAASAPPSRKA